MSVRIYIQTPDFTMKINAALGANSGVLLYRSLVQPRPYIILTNQALHAGLVVMAGKHKRLGIIRRFVGADERNVMPLGGEVFSGGAAEEAFADDDGGEVVVLGHRVNLFLIFLQFADFFKIGVGDAVLFELVQICEKSIFEQLGSTLKGMLGNPRH